MCLWWPLGERLVVCADEAEARAVVPEPGVLADPMPIAALAAYVTRHHGPTAPSVYRARWPEAFPA